LMILFCCLFTMCLMWNCYTFTGFSDMTLWCLIDTHFAGEPVAFVVRAEKNLFLVTGTTPFFISKRSIFWHTWNISCLWFVNIQLYGFCEE
jgi:hypothetical protein